MIKLQQFWYLPQLSDQRSLHNIESRGNKKIVFVFGSLVVIDTSLYADFLIKRGRFFFKHDDVIKWKHFPRHWPL